jgi:LCP family protein required for cell wall assembly
MKTGAFALCVLLAAGYVVNALAADSALTEEQYSAIDQALSDRSRDLPVAEEFRVKVQPDDLSVREGLDENWMNILLLGTDTGNIALNYGLTDTMIILSVNRQTGKMRLSSLVRDMQVSLPFHNRLYKINAANAFGGPLLAVKTVNETFGLNIHHYVSINFNGFTKVIDNLGGVELVLTDDEAGLVGVPYSSQAQVLNGEQALNYVRIKLLDDNFGRNERQRMLLSSLFRKILGGSDMVHAMAAMTEALKHMATNLSINDLFTLIVPVFTGMESMDTAGFPAAGDYRHKATERQEAVIEFDLEITRQKLHDYIYLGITP